MPSLTYLSTIRKYYSTSRTSSYVCTRRHVGNSRKRHDIDGPKMEQERQMSPNVGPTFSNMSLTCHPTRQCRVKIANANIRQTQLSFESWRLCVPPACRPTRTPIPGRPSLQPHEPPRVISLLPPTPSLPWLLVPSWRPLPRPAASTLSSPAPVPPHI